MTIITDTYQNILYFLNLTVNTELLWIILPLAIATIIMITYFERYKEEQPGWNSHVANSLVFLFVSVILFRYINSINQAGTINFINFPGKTIVSFLILLIGIIILFLNFKHYLPEIIARHISSPLTLNLIAYIAILFVYSGTEVSGKILLSPGLQNPWAVFLSLLLLFILFLVVLNILKIPIKNLFLKLKKMKDKEKVESIKQDKKPIIEKKKELKKEEKIIKKQKKEVKKEEKKLAKSKLKELDKQKKEAIKLKKVVKR